MHPEKLKPEHYDGSHPQTVYAGAPVRDEVEPELSVGVLRAIRRRVDKRPHGHILSLCPSFRTQRGSQFPQPFLSALLMLD